MLADFFTKWLGGSLFKTMIDICQGLLPIEKLLKRHKQKKENRVEKENETKNSMTVLQFTRSVLEKF